MSKSETTAEDIKQFSPGTHGCHEALHVASMLMEMVDEYLCGHTAIRLRPQWQAKADAARDALFDLYQGIGAEHM